MRPTCRPAVRAGHDAAAPGGAGYLAFIQSENRKWGPVIKVGNIRAEWSKLNKEY